MMHSKRTMTWGMAVIVLVTLSACGQMGPLTLPDEDANTEEQESDEENER